MEGDVITLQNLFVAQYARARSARTAPRCSDRCARPAFGPASCPSSAPTASSSALGVAGGPVRKLLAALALGALVLPAAAPRPARRRADPPRRRKPVPARAGDGVVPAGSRPILTEGGRRAAFVKDRELGSAQAMVLAVDNSASMTGGPLREAKQAATAFLSASTVQMTRLSSHSGTRRCL